MHMVAAGNRSDLAGGEEAGDRVEAERLSDLNDVVIGAGKHRSTAPVAGEQQRPRAAAALAELRQQLAEVLVGGSGITNLEPHGGADVHRVADDDSTGSFVGSQDRG
ncbi:MAG: hypothetical protein JWO57_3542 [Pseudonocardiales bacterium]|nr:hypothetical protein [Pseudonocardiales bacterium]